MRASLAILGLCACLVGGCGGAGADHAVKPPAPAGLPAPAAPLPRDARGLAADLTRTTLALRAEVERWIARGNPRVGGPPRAVTLLALHQQLLYRSLADQPRHGEGVLRMVAPSVAAEARDTVGARRSLAAIPITPGAPRPRIRIGPAEPAGALRDHYLEAQRRFGIDWSVLAAVNFVESAFGRLRNASSAGAQGPMQFLPSTWDAHGLGGDLHDPHDAILGAASYLRDSGAPAHLARALYAYNPSTAYVRAILRFAHRMRTDWRTYYAYYAWQVFVAGPHGPRRVTGPR